MTKNENIFPTDQDNSIINSLNWIGGMLFNVKDSLTINEKIQLANRINKSINLINSVIKDMEKKKIDFECGL